MKKHTTNHWMKFHIKITNLSLFSTLLWITAGQYAYCEEKTQLPPPNSTQLENELNRQQDLLIQQGKEIESLRLLLQELKSQQPPNNNTNQTATKTQPQVEKPVGKAPPDKATQIEISPQPKLSTNVSGILTRKGTTIIEPAIGYAYTDSTRVFLDAYSFIPALVVGVIDLREIKRHTFIASLTARYGISERWEFGLKLPYLAREDQQRSRPVSVGVSEDEIFNASGSGIGDIELSTRYQLNYGLNGSPIYVANLVVSVPTGKSPFEIDYVESAPGIVFPTELPTGTGYYSLQPSISAVYATDPGVLFGNLSYGYSIETDQDVGEVDPGDSIGLGFGLGLSLNERTSLSVGYSHKHVLESKINGTTIDGSELDIGQLIIGYSFNYSPKTNINLSLNVGVTDDAPDVRLDLKLPMAF